MKSELTMLIPSLFMDLTKAYGTVRIQKLSQIDVAWSNLIFLNSLISVYWF